MSEPETDDEHEILSNVGQAVLRVAAARLDPNVTHRDFVDEVYSLVDAVREEDRDMVKFAIAAATTPAAPARPTYRLKDADRARVIELLAAEARTPTGKLPAGVADVIARKVGCSKLQVQRVAHEQRGNGHG